MEANIRNYTIVIYTTIIRSKIAQQRW